MDGGKTLQDTEVFSVSLFILKGDKRLKIVDKRLDELTEYEKNPRKNDGAVDGVAESIKRFGFKVPIIVDKGGVIVAGHTRFKAAKKLNLETVPCIVADDLTEKQIKAFRLADNKVSEKSEWDFDLLNGELGDLFDFDMESFGFASLDDHGDDEAAFGDFFGDKEEKPPKEEKEIQCPHCKMWFKP